MSKKVARPTQPRKWVSYKSARPWPMAANAAYTCTFWSELVRSNRGDLIRFFKILNIFQTFGSGKRIFILNGELAQSLFFKPKANLESSDLAVIVN